MPAASDVVGSARVLRTVVAYPVAALLAHWLRLPLDYFAPVLVLTALGMLLGRFSFKLAAAMILLVGLVTLLLSWVLTPLLGSTTSYLTVVGFGLFGAFRLQSHPRLAPIAALSIPLLVLFGPIVPLAGDYAAALSLLLTLLTLCAVGGVLLSWVIVPGPAGTPTPPARQPVRSVTDCAISAAIMVGLIGLTLRLDAQSALRLLMIASTVLSVPDPKLGSKVAGLTLAATLVGIGAAFVVRHITFVAQSPTLAALVAALIVLIIGRRLIAPATAQVATTGLVTLTVLLGASGSVDDSKLLAFLLYTVSGIAIAIGLRHTLLWHFEPRTRAAAIV